MAGEEGTSSRCKGIYDLNMLSYMLAFASETTLIDIRSSNAK
jgi:hypothetical protein